MEQLKSWETKKKIFALFGILSALLTVGNLFIPIFSGDLSSIVETLKIGNNEVFGLYSNGISLVGFAVACIKIVNSFGKVLGSLSGVYIAIAVFVGIIALFCVQHQKYQVMRHRKFRSISKSTMSAVEGVPENLYCPLY